MSYLNEKTSQKKKPKTVLVVEDNPETRELLNDILESMGHEMVGVGTSQEALTYLKEHQPNLLLLDYGLPDLTGRELIEILMENNQTIPPFIVFTGQRDEQIAVEMMKLGAKDYLIKDLNFFDLLPEVVNRVFQIIRNEKKLNKAEEELRLHSKILEHLCEGVYLVRASDNTIVYTNPKFEAMFGYEPGEMLGKHVSIVNAPTDQTPKETAKQIHKSLLEYGQWSGEVKNIKKDGTRFWSRATVSNFEHSKFGKVWVNVHQDITERKKAKQELHKSEETFRTIVENVPVLISSFNKKGECTIWNKEAEKQLGYTVEDFHNEKNSQELLYSTEEAGTMRRNIQNRGGGFQRFSSQSERWNHKNTGVGQLRSTQWTHRQYRYRCHKTVGTGRTTTAVTKTGGDGNIGWWNRS